MFSNTLVALMVMIMLCFLGMLIMFLFVIRSLGTLTQSLKEAERRQQAVLTDIENAVMEIHFSMQRFGEAPAYSSNGSSIPGLEEKADLNTLMDTLTRRDMPDTLPPSGHELSSIIPSADLNGYNTGQHAPFPKFGEAAPSKIDGNRAESGLQINLDD